MEKNYKSVDPKVNFVQLEHEILQWWEEHQTFHRLVEKNQNGPRWSFLDGPITANNPMGVHHAWGRTYKDIFHRYQAMRGHQTVSLTIGAKQALVNGREHALDVAPHVEGGVTFVALRFVSESLGADVSYDSTSREVRVDLADESWCIRV